tara:strand:+ start:664 stop:777 length:114 start_codon:yes stop_codon:yes gene_type:complete
MVVKGEDTKLLKEIKMHLFIMQRFRHFIDIWLSVLDR